MKGMRYVFPAPGGREHVVEFTYHEGCVGSPEEWAASHMRAHAREVSAGTATATIVEEFESEVPVRRGFYRQSS